MKNRNEQAQAFRAAHDSLEAAKGKQSRFHQRQAHQRELVRELEQKAAAATKAKDQALADNSLETLGDQELQVLRDEHKAAADELAQAIELLQAMEANGGQIERELDEARRVYKAARSEYFGAVAGDIEAALQRDNKLRTSLADLFACYALGADGDGVPRWDLVLDGCFPFLNDAEHESAIGRIAEKHLAPLGLAEATRKAS